MRATEHNCQQVAPNSYATTATALALPTNRWPSVLETTLGNGKRLELPWDAIPTDNAVTYRQGKLTLRVTR